MEGSRLVAVLMSLLSIRLLRRLFSVLAVELLRARVLRNRGVGCGELLERVVLLCRDLFVLGVWRWLLEKLLILDCGVFEGSLVCSGLFLTGGCRF
jgi:hypothetical protein